MSDSEQDALTDVYIESDDSLEDQRNEARAKLQLLVSDLGQLEDSKVFLMFPGPPTAEFSRRMCDSAEDGPVKCRRLDFLRTKATSPEIESEFRVWWSGEDRLYHCAFTTLRGSQVMIKRSHAERDGLIRLIMPLLEIFPELDEFESR